MDPRPNIQNNFIFTQEFPFKELPHTTIIYISSLNKENKAVKSGDFHIIRLMHYLNKTMFFHNLSFWLLESTPLRDFTSVDIQNYGLLCNKPCRGLCRVCRRDSMGFNRQPSKKGNFYRLFHLTSKLTSQLTSVWKYFWFVSKY